MERYGRSKLNAEVVIRELESDMGSPVYIYRLPGVFGKWCKPNYNSVVATFCHNISHNLPVRINDPSFELFQFSVAPSILLDVRFIYFPKTSNFSLIIKVAYAAIAFKS